MIYVITGHYGSGKTEIAVNLAKKLKNPYIVDMDIVNPYFRTADVKEMLTELGVKVITPEFANTNVDVPSLPPDVFAALQSDNDVILDVGGDDDGAIVLGQYNKYFEKGYEMYFVMNFCRPMTSDADGVLEILRDIETVSRIKVTGLINNTNVRGDTTAALLQDSIKKAEEVSEAINVPILAVSGTYDILKDVNTNHPKMELSLNLALPWEKY